MTPASIPLPDRPLVVRPPGAGLASQAWQILVAVALAVGLVCFLVPHVEDLITDWQLAGVAVPVPGGHATGRCSLDLESVADCNGELTAPGNRHRSVHFFFLDLSEGDHEVTVVADPAHPELLTTDLALAHLWNRALTLAISLPLFAAFVLGLMFATGKDLRRQRATVRALSNQPLRLVLLRMADYAVDTWIVASPSGVERRWQVPRRARPIVIDPDRRLVLGVTAGYGTFTVPLDRALRWIGLEPRERQAMLDALGPNPVGPWLAALDTPARAAARDRLRRLARGVALAGLTFVVATAGVTWWAFGTTRAGDLSLLAFALCIALAIGLLIGAAIIRAKVRRYEAILR